jgi:hypothetical protein
MAKLTLEQIRKNCGVQFNEFSKRPAKTVTHIDIANVLALIHDLALHVQELKK